MANVDQDARLAGRNIIMILSPLPKAQQKRHFVLDHGELIEEDDFEDDDDVEELEDDASGDEESESDEKSESNEGSESEKQDAAE